MILCASLSKIKNACTQRPVSMSKQSALNKLRKTGLHLEVFWNLNLLLTGSVENSEKSMPALLRQFM